MDIRIGNIEPQTDIVFKFVVLRIDGDVLLFADQVGGHESIARDHHVMDNDDILAGGKILFEDGKLLLFDHSDGFGGVPPELLRPLVPDLATLFGISESDVEIKTDRHHRITGLFPNLV